MNSNLVFILILGQLSQINCLTKSYFAFNQWFENTKQWSAKRLPCLHDTVILPENIALYLDKPITANKIILPKNGILILDQDNWITKVNNECTKGQENKLIISKNDWFDTINWNVKYHAFEFRGDDELYNPIPHINRIPCQQDEVRFKPKSTFKLLIDLENKNYKLKNLFINNQKLNSRDFERYSKSKIGKLQFKINGELPFYITNDDQNEQTIQLCQNNFNYFYNKICRNVINKCPKLKCKNAIRSFGSCCSLCGSIINIDYYDNKIINYDFIENILTNLHLDKYHNVNYFLSKISNTKIEIIILDQKTDLNKINYGILESRIFAQELIDFFKKENFYQIQSIEHHFSEYLNETNRSIYLIIFILILIIFILLFVYSNQLPYLNSITQHLNNNWTANYCRTIITDSPFTFIRFSSDHEDLEMELNEPNQLNNRQTINENRNDFKLRVKNDSISSNISNSILFTVDEQEISFDNPFFKDTNLQNLKNTIDEE